MWSRVNRWCHDLEPNYGIYLALYFSLALITGWVSFHSRKLGLNEAAAFQHGIYLGDRSHGHLSDVHATRVLFPYLLHSVHAVSGLPVPYAFALLRLGSIFLSYCLFHWYLRGWFDARGALIGTLFLAASIPATFVEWFEIPTDFVELIVFILGFAYIRDNRYLLLCLVIAVGTLNRETTVFLVVFYFFNAFGGSDRQGLAILKTAVAGFTWLLVFLGLKSGLGVGTLHYFLDPGYWLQNVEGLRGFIKKLNIYNNNLSWLYAFHVFWVLWLVGLRRKPRILLRSLMGVPVFLFVYLFGGGSLAEARELMPLYPLLIPAGLFTLYQAEPPAAGKGVPA